VFDQNTGEKIFAREDSKIPNLLRPSVVTKANPSTYARAAGTYVEEMDRLALFLDQVKKGNTYDGAAQHVRKFLFDYGDLTRFEKGFKDNVSRFYTFLRKNTALQAEMLATQPGTVRAVAKISKEMTEGVAEFLSDNGDDGESRGFAPPWVQAAGMIALSGGGYAGPDSPLTASMKAAEAIAAIGTIPLTYAGLDEEMPESLQSALFYGDAPDQWQRLSSLFSGVLPAAFGIITEGQTGINAFTGARTEDSAKAPLLNLAGAINPGVDGVWRLLDDLGALDTDFVSMFTNEEKIEDIYDRADEKRKKAIIAEMDKAEKMGREPRSDAYAELPTGDEAVAEFLNKGKVEDRSTMFLNWVLGINYYDQQRQESSSYWTLMQDLREITDAPGSPSLTDLREEGHLQAKNAVGYALIYSRDKAELDEELIKYLGREDAHNLGLEVPNFDPNAPDSEEAQDAERIILNKVRAMEAIQGEALSPDQYGILMMGSSFAPYKSDIEEGGYEPLNTTNRFVENDSFSREMTLEQTQQRLAQMAAWGGYTLDEVVGPRKPDIDRAIAEGLAAGMTRDQVLDWWIQNEYNRTEYGVQFGPENLEKFSDGTRSQREEQQEQTNAWQKTREYSYVYQYLTGTAPTEQWLIDNVWMANANKSDQELVGGPVRPSISNRENIQSDAAQKIDAFKEYESQQLGRFGPYVGDLSDSPEPILRPQVAPGRFANNSG